MNAAGRQSLDYYLSLDYPFHAVPDEAGGWTIIYPDLPGCLSIADTLADLPAMAEEARRLWIEVEYERGSDIPLPSYPEEYSGKFNLRLPRSLHRSLAKSAEREGVSLNQYVVSLLSSGNAVAEVMRRLDALEMQMDEIHEGIRYQSRDLASHRKA